jgi:methylated-DNA-protein-cysteine methyltransferase-like protein
VRDAAEPRDVEETWHEAVRAIVRLIPRGRVATYGQIAALLEHCTPRMVGWVMAALPDRSDVPWQRVINSSGEVSPRAHGSGQARQRRMLEAEGVVFDQRGRVDLKRFGWEVEE